MSNNSTTTTASSACIRPSNFLELIYNTHYVAYNIVTPLYFIFSFFGNGVLLLAFLKQARSERAYMYQVYSASARTLEVLIRTLCSISTKAFLVVPGVYRDSFQTSLSRCYLCAWYAVHLSSPMIVAFTTLSLLLAAAMTGDRVFSLVKPLVYKNMKHRRNQLIVLAVSIVVSFALSAFDIMRMNVYPTVDGSTYNAVLDTAYMSQPIVQTLALFRVLFQASALVILVALSLALCYFFRTKFMNLKAKVTGASDQDKSRERALIVITLTECSLTILTICVMMTYYAFVYCYPIVYSCWQPVVVPIHDACRMLVEVSNFYVVLAISKKFRSMVKKLLRSLFNDDGQSTTVVSVVSVKSLNRDRS